MVKSLRRLTDKRRMVKWGLYRDKGNWVIRRGSERYPVQKYKRIRGNEEFLRALVLQLNAPLRAKEELAFKHSLVNEELLEEYEQWLGLQVPNEFNARSEFKLLKKHFLNFFIGKLGLNTPAEWHQVHDTKWAKYLTSDDEEEIEVTPKGSSKPVKKRHRIVPPSPKSKRSIIQAANRFVSWVHKKRPEFMPDLKFDPLGKAYFKKSRADWNQDERHRKRFFVSDSDWLVISKDLPANIKARVMLAYHYGLRRREALGLQQGDVKNKYLLVERQLMRLNPVEGKPKYAVLKGRECRKTPHWFCSEKGAMAYSWIKEAENLKEITPTEFSTVWAEYIGSLKDAKKIEQNYDLHDLRHTFITKAVRKYNVVDVMHAVGHKNIETTMRYLHDDRTLGDEEYVPDDAA